MGQKFRASALVPQGFVVEKAICEGPELRITIRPLARSGVCPGCGAVSGRIHSRYQRSLSDLPVAGRPVRLIALVRRFHCDAVLCGRRIFTERFGAEVLAPWARRTSRLEHLVHHLALALGGRPAASFARRLMLPVSNDTLLRVVRRRPRKRIVPPSIIGIDDWAWRRNQRYGTLICDLERRRTIALLPDREPATAAAWLSAQPQISVVVRDRGGSYALAAARALPLATQVADRWHLMENASRAFLDAVRRSMRQIRSAIGGITINPDLLTAAERIQYQGYLRREETNAAILALAGEGLGIKEIVRRTGHSRGLIRRILRGQRSDVFRTRESSLDLFLPWLDAQWAAGEQNGAALWRQMRQQGFRGCLRVVSEWATRRRQADKTEGALRRIPASRTIARLLTVDCGQLSKSETVMVAAIEIGVPALVEARELIAAFQTMIRKRTLVTFDPWIESAKTSLLASFVNGVIKDRAAVSAAISSPWSNGQAEGQITKLKLVKRQMYGRGKIDLLEARVIGGAEA